ncbi:MAG: Gfo/Idh/MocA family oxidoreductase [Gammaproteobacteria bacterium]|nr:Gfo/Idh/MocA family oxidoreductase [Gammaproteobacteria bacterium]
MSSTFDVGLIGCGDISEAYLRLSPLFRGITIVACADRNLKTAAARADEFNIEALSVADLLSRDHIDLVVNLTTPEAHYEVSKQILESGKHVYSEKPFVLSRESGAELMALAAEQGLRIGSAPDTFLGGAHQQARALIDEGAIGKVLSGTAHVMNFGMEHWHPNPDFFFKQGAGPILDIGPYYITNLVQLIGPIKRVAGMSAIPSSTRTISSEPREGETITVETATTIHAVLEFHSGALITLGASWDVWHNGHQSMELYGETGTLYLPDPNFFGGELVLTDKDTLKAPMPPTDHPFAVPNEEHDEGMQSNYRVSGLADMAESIAQNRPHRCSAELALHVVDVMTSILESSESRQFIEIETTCTRPEALTSEQAAELLA